MRYNKIKKNDTANGSGVNVSVYFQYCPHRCTGCFNKETWDKNGGKPYTDKVKNEIIDSLNANGAERGLCVLGGEPLCPENVDGVIDLCKSVKEKYPDKMIWLWTGYLLENFDKKQQQIMAYIDVIIDGPFILQQRNLNLDFKGSENQRVVDVKKSLDTGEIVLYKRGGNVNE